MKRIPSKRSSDITFSNNNPAGVTNEAQHMTAKKLGPRQRKSKSFIEKKRRARINCCLEELKQIVLTANNKEASKSKFEKADILEMTLKYLQTIAKPSGCIPTEREERSYAEGYNACAQAVRDYFEDNGNLGIRESKEEISKVQNKNCHENSFYHPTSQERPLSDLNGCRQRKVDTDAVRSAETYTHANFQLPMEAKPNVHNGAARVQIPLKDEDSRLLDDTTSKLTCGVFIPTQNQRVSLSRVLPVYTLCMNPNLQPFVEAQCNCNDSTTNGNDTLSKKYFRYFEHLKQAVDACCPKNNYTSYLSRSSESLNRNPTDSVTGNPNNNKTICVETATKNESNSKEEALNVHSGEVWRPW